MSVLRYFITSKAKRNLLNFFFTAGDSAFYTRQIARLTGEPLNAVRRELGYMEKAGLLRSYTKGNQKYYEIVQDFPLLAEWKKIVLETHDTAVDTSARSAKQLARLADTVKAIVRPVKYVDKEPIIPGTEVVMKHVPAAEGIDAVQRSAQTTEPGPAVDSSKELQQPSQTTEAGPEVAGGQTGEEHQVFTVPSFVNHLKDQFNEINSIALAIIHGESAKAEEIPAKGIDLLLVGDIDKDALLELIGDIEDQTGVAINLTRMTRSDFDYRNAKGDPLIRRIWSEKKLVVKGRHQMAQN